LADLLLDPQSVPAELRQHVEECAGCSRELAELRATMGMLDDWAVPEVNPFFDAKLLARCGRRAGRNRLASVERWKARFLYGSRLADAAADGGRAGVVVLIGGGTYADLSWQAAQPEPGIGGSARSAVARRQCPGISAARFGRSIGRADNQNSGTAAPSSD
jgi:hypothetical protein